MAGHHCTQQLKRVTVNSLWKLAETDEKSQILWSKKCEIDFFFDFFITKVFYFVSNMNYDFHEASFEVYYIFVSQKLAILGFSSNLTDVSNFS